MHQGGPASWRIGIDEPQDLVIGLFVRDVAGLTSRHVWLPPAAPATPRASGEGSADASHQWDLWWDRALAADLTMTAQSLDQIARTWWSPPDFESLQSAPALQAVVARHFNDAVAWSRERQREHVERVMGAPDRRRFHRGRNDRALLNTNLVADLERDLGRRAEPFELRITVIPVAGQQLWQLDPHHVLIAAELLADPDEYRRCITPVLQALL